MRSEVHDTAQDTATTRPTLHALAAAASPIALILGALAVLYVLNPTETSWMPPCPSWHYLHLHCPGCGTGRGLHRLAHGDVLGAMRMNLLLIPGAALIIAIALAETISLWRGRPKPAWVYAPALGRAAVVIAIAFSILRNIPHPAFAWLAPH